MIGRRSDDPSTSILVLGGSLIAAFVASSAYLGNIHAHARWFQMAFLLGCVGHAFITQYVLRTGHDGSWKWWFFACLLARFVLLTAEPSDDVHRYVWEGRIQAMGHNPYIVPPDDPSLAEFRDEHWSRINHPDYTAIYPPLSQWVFRIVVSVHSSPLFMKGCFVGFDVLGIVILSAWMKQAGLPRQRLVVYALCPLTLTSFAIEGHLDSLAIACMAAAGWANLHRRPYVCAALVAGAILSKWTPMILVPWLLWRNVRAGVFCLLLTALGCWVYADAGWGLFESLFKFSTFTSSLGLFHHGTQDMMGGGTARMLAVAMVAGVAAWSVARRLELADYARRVFGVLILVLPVVHYWYLTWLLVFLPLRPRWSWLVLAAGWVFYFEAWHRETLTGRWEFPPWIIPALYLPFLVVCAIEFLTHRHPPRPIR